jgi:hypothetical protein
MKRLKYISFIAAFTLFISCEEVIEIDLNSADPAIVVDGSICFGETAEVQLSYTQDYFSNDSTQYIENAYVTLIAGNDETEVLEYTENGIYLGKTMFGKSNTNYELKIELPDQEISGESEIRSEIELISMTLKETTFSSPGKQENTDSIYFNLNLTFTDVMDEQNYYMLAITQNGETGEYSYLLINDEFYSNTGKISYTPMMYQLAEGDTINMKLYSLDENTYTFYNQLADITNESGISGTGTPYNPTSNMGDNILGYFAAWAMIDTSFIVTQANF